MNKKLVIILLTLILLLGTFLRFYQLGKVPISPDWDEVALAYDAHSIFLTGHDEFGNFLPFILRSYDDYKPALYSYIAIPSVEIFGLTTFGIRFPSAVMGIVAILAMYFLVKELFLLHDEKEKKTIRTAEILGLLSSFLLAVSPWHIQFSRVAFETNVGLTFNILIALFFIKSFKHPWLLILSTFLAGLNLSVYQSERVFTPLLVLALVIIFRKQLFALNKKIIVGAALAGIIAILPALVFFSMDKNALLRVKATSIFSNQTEVLKKSIVRLADDKQTNDYVGLVLDNRRLTFAKSIADAYISHFDPKWLFLTGDINRHHAPQMGLLYLVFLPFILIGIYQLLFGSFDRRTKNLIIAWLLIGPIPASITTGVPHAVRTLNSLPAYIIFTALGLFTVFVFVTKINYKIIKIPVKYLLLSFVFILFMFNFTYFLNQYFVQQNYYYAYDWQYGYEKAIPIVEQLKKNYNTVIVSDREPLDKSYMFFLFYLKYPPADYQRIGVSSSGGFSNIHHFDKYQFHNFTWDNVKNDKKRGILFVGGAKDFPGQVKTRETISYPNGDPAILIVDPNDNP